MPSATTAERRDSIDPSSVNAAALGSTARILAMLISGRAGMGRPAGIPPNRVPMVAIGRSRMRLKSMKPLLPPKPVSLRKNSSIAA